MIKLWIPFRYQEGENGMMVQVPGSNNWSKEYLQEGKFHQWGTETEEGETGFVARSVAIVELPDGTIQNVLPNNVKFID